MDGELLHDWLPPEDEANRFRFYVPRPDEITRRAEEIRAGWGDNSGGRYWHHGAMISGIKEISLTRGRFRATHDEA